MILSDISLTPYVKQKTLIEALIVPSEFQKITALVHEAQSRSFYTFQRKLSGILQALSIPFYNLGVNSLTGILLLQ